MGTQVKKFSLPINLGKDLVPGKKVKIPKPGQRRKLWPSQGINPNSSLPCQRKARPGKGFWGKFGTP